MSLLRSTRCCNRGPPFATVSLLDTTAEIHVSLQGTPCCDQEFQSFVSILITMRNKLDRLKPFYLLYNLLRYTFNRSHMAIQHEVMEGAAACVIIMPKKSLWYSVVKLATAVKTGTKIKICNMPSDGKRWLRENTDLYKK
jgi:hypothetical protein